MTSERPEDEEFHWLVGQSLTPKHYKRLGQIWEVGKVWMSTKTLERSDGAGLPALNEVLGIAAQAKGRAPSGKKRQGLAKEEDLLKKESPLKARLFGRSSPLTKSK
jgi:hypothetical protein